MNNTHNKLCGNGKVTQFLCSSCTVEVNLSVKPQGHKNGGARPSQVLLQLLWLLLLHRKFEKKWTCFQLLVLDTLFLFQMVFKTQEISFQTSSHLLPPFLLPPSFPRLATALNHNKFITIYILLIQMITNTLNTSWCS